MTATSLYEVAAELSATAADLAAAIDTDEPTYDLARHAANLLTDLNAGLDIGVPPDPADLRHIARRLRRDLDTNRRPGASDFNPPDFQALGVAEEAGELVGAYRRWSGRARRTGTLADLEAEVADVLIVTAVFAERADTLRAVPAAVRFISAEPLLGPLDGLTLDGIGWVIAGGESGPGHRPPDPAWFRTLRDQCAAAGVPFFFKQWGGPTPKAGGRVLDGRTWDQMPATTLTTTSGGAR